MKNFLYALILFTVYTKLNGMQNINSLDEAEYTIDHSRDQELIKAVINRDISKIEHLLKLKNRPDIHTLFNCSLGPFSTRECTPLIYAATMRNVPQIKALIPYETDINHKNHFGQTALHAAINDIFSGTIAPQLTGNSSPQKIEIINTLLQAGANPTIQDNYGRSTLLYAAKKETAEIIKLLLYQTYFPIGETVLKELQAWVLKEDAELARRGTPKTMYTLFPRITFINKIISEYRQETLEKAIDAVAPGTIANGNITNIIMAYAQLTPEEIQQ